MLLSFFELHAHSYCYRAGQGALARLGTFWYPVRLLKKLTKDERPVWRVRWWRRNQFVDAPTSNEAVIPEADIVDELWNEPERRRSIRVSIYSTL